MQGWRADQVSGVGKGARSTELLLTIQATENGGGTSVTGQTGRPQRPGKGREEMDTRGLAWEPCEV